MKHLALAGLLAIPAALAVPSSELQDVINELASYTDLTQAIFGEVAKGVAHVVEDVEKALFKGAKQTESWLDQFGREFVRQHEIIYERVSNPVFSDYALRVTDPEICDPNVEQHSGYLDISDEKHLFFWFFESRTSPEDAPLVLWLNGGPGCSSTAGLLMELGPCRIQEGGKNVSYNEYGWNTHANVIFLDQPVNVGYSYTSDGSTVNTSPAAGIDVYAFLELFLQRYPKYAKAPFHIAAESYGGTYAPNFASVIHKKNAELKAKQALAPTPGVVHINLASVMLGNGLSDPLVQYPAIYDYACDPSSPYPVWEENSVECQALKTKVPTCQRLAQSCYNYDSKLTCVPAYMYCASQMYGSFMQLNKNPYDVRRSCNRETDGSLCYQEMTWVQNFMNEPSVKAALGVPGDLTFESCNTQVNQEFAMQGDGMHNAASLLPELIDDGIRLLVYAGNADFMCNFIGNERWLEALDTPFSNEFASKPGKPWVTFDGAKVAGRVRAAGSGAGNVTFVEVYDAGHMVPFDQDLAALDMFDRWLFNIPLDE